MGENGGEGSSKGGSKGSGRVGSGKGGGPKSGVPNLPSKTGGAMNLPIRLTPDAEGLELVRVGPRHCEATYEAVRDSLHEIQRWQGWAHAEYSFHDAATWAAECWLDWDARRGFQFVVLERGRVVGAAGVGEINTTRQDGNLGYWVRTDATGRGVATAAATAVARFAFAHAGLRRLHLWHALGNEGSRRVAEKVGFVREGRLRAYTTLNGTPVDAVMYSVISPSEIAPGPTPSTLGK